MTDLKHRIRTEWSKLDHAVIAAALRECFFISQDATGPAAVILSTVFD